MQPVQQDASLRELVARPASVEAGVEDGRDAGGGDSGGGGRSGSGGSGGSGGS